MLKNYKEKNYELDRGGRANLITALCQRSFLFMSGHTCALALRLVADVIDHFCCRCRLMTTQNLASTHSAFDHSRSAVICTLLLLIKSTSIGNVRHALFSLQNAENQMRGNAKGRRKKLTRIPDHANPTAIHLLALLRFPSLVPFV